MMPNMELVFMGPPPPPQPRNKPDDTFAKETIVPTSLPNPDSKPKNTKWRLKAKTSY